MDTFPFPPAQSAQNRLRQHFVVGLALLGTVLPALAQNDFEYIVRPGDNPWNITARYLKSINYWPRIQRYNNILEPTAIVPGTRLRMPTAWMRGEAGSARVIDVRGSVEHEINGRAEALAAGMMLDAGTLIRTHDRSSLALQFPDGSRSLISANTELRVSHLQRLTASGAQQLRIELKRGQIENSVQPARSGGSRYTIETPAAIAAVRGTEFRVTTVDGRMRTETLSGEVALRNGRGETRLPAATGAEASAGEAPGKAVSLLPAPNVDALPETIDRVPFRLPIAPIEGALRYRTQIAPQQGFTVLESDRVAEDASALGSASLADGRYRMRVRGIDSEGLEGLSAEREIVVDARPEPPFPSTPAPDGFAVDEKIVFRWAHVPGAQAYHFQLAGDDRFSSPIVTLDAGDEASVTLGDEVPSGNYFWRVAVSTAAEGRGPWSDTQRFRRPPAGPAAEAPEVDGDTLRLRWRAGNADDRYQVELSRTADFVAPEHAFDTAIPEASIDQPEPGTWHVRIRTQEPGSPPGPWGTPQQIEVPHNHWRALYVLLPLLLAL
ncbi:MAG TPA: FecR domain-containing protein [Thauera sp.]|nr:FecR domain-containing protein [Thauera sp.]